MYENEIYIYLRKSRSDDPSLSIEEVLSRHETILQDYAKKNLGFLIPESQIFREVVSGETIDDRPLMKQLIHLLESDSSIKGVLVVEPQRLSRGDLVDCGTIINTFRYTNTLVLTPPKTYNLTDEYDRKFLEMELMRGNDYLEYTKRILARGREASVRSGNYIGSIRPYGYQKVTYGTGKDKVLTLEPIADEAKTVQLIYQLYTEGKGINQIASYLDQIGIAPPQAEYWSPRTIYEILNNTIYIGLVKWGNRKVIKTIVDGKIVKTRPRNSPDTLYFPGKHPAIIEKELFDHVQTIMGNAPKIKRSRELQNPYASIVFCSNCGKALSMKKYVQSTKTGHVTKSMVCNNQSHCHTRSCLESAFTDRVRKSLIETIHDFEVQLSGDNLQAKMDIREHTIEMLKVEIQKCKERDLRQKDAFEDGIYTKNEYLQRNAKLQEQLSKLTHQLNNLEASMTPTAHIEEKLSKFTAALHALDDFTVSAAEKNRLLKECIERIEYHNDAESKPGKGRFEENPFSLDIFFKL